MIDTALFIAAVAFFATKHAYAGVACLIMLVLYVLMILHG